MLSEDDYCMIDRDLSDIQYAINDLRETNKLIVASLSNLTIAITKLTKMIHTAVSKGGR